MEIIYFAGGNRLETLRTVFKMKDITIKKIFVASIEPNIEKYKNFALEKNIKCIVANKTNIINLFKYEDEDLLLSVGYRFIIPIEVFQQPKYAINIHPSLLPKYRGAYSGFAIIENGEKETGLTAHYIDEGIDTGDLIFQEKIPLKSSDTINSMSNKIAKIEPAFVKKTIESIKNNSFKRIINKIGQNDIIYNNKRKPKDSEIDSNLPLKLLLNKIRSCDQKSFPAYAYLNDVKIILKLEEVNNGLL